MKKEKGKLILEPDDDYEFIRLIEYIDELGYGEFLLKVKHHKPFMITESKEFIKLVKEKRKVNLEIT